MATKRKQLFAEIDAERSRQDDKWGGSEHDDTHSIEAWVAYIVVQLGEAVDTDNAVARRQLVRVAAMAIAAVEVLDRSV